MPPAKPKPGKKPVTQRFVRPKGGAKSSPKAGPASPSRGPMGGPHRGLPIPGKSRPRPMSGPSERGRGPKGNIPFDAPRPRPGGLLNLPTRSPGVVTPRPVVISDPKGRMKAK